jgi:hypothetical protein
VLERFQISDDVGDLTRIEAECGHGRMSGDNAFRQRLFEVLNRIPQMQGAKRRCGFQGLGLTLSIA